MTDIEEKMVGITNESDGILANSSGCPWRQDYLSRQANMISLWKKAGLFVEADLDEINCYWLQFEPAPVVYHMALAALFFVIFFVGSVGNGIVVYITSTYFVITWPERNEEQNNKSLIRSYCIVIIIWLYSGAIASMPLFGVGKYVPEGYLTSCSFDYLSNDSTTRIFILIFFIMAWVVPICIIIASYSAVIRFVTRNPNLSYRERAIEVMSGTLSEEHSHSKHEYRKRRKKAKLEKRIAKTSAILVALWIISWTPYAFVSLLGISGFHSLLTPGLAMLPALFAKASASINPFVYSLNHPKVRIEIERRFRCCCFRFATTNRGNSSSRNTSSRSRTRQRKRRDSPILHFRSRLASNNKKSDRSSYELREINNHLHPSSQLLDQLYCGRLNASSSGMESRVLQPTSPSFNNDANSKLRATAGACRERLIQSETLCCADVHHHPSPRTRRNYKRTFKSESNNERRANDFFGEQPVLEYLTSVV